MKLAIMAALFAALCGCTTDRTTELTCTEHGRVTFQSEPGRWVLRASGWYDYRNDQGYSPSLLESCAARRVLP